MPKARSERRRELRECGSFFRSCILSVALSWGHVGDFDEGYRYFRKFVLQVALVQNVGALEQRVFIHFSGLSHPQFVIQAMKAFNIIDILKKTEIRMDSLRMRLSLFWNVC